MREDTLISKELDASRAKLSPLFFNDLARIPADNAVLAAPARQKSPSRAAGIAGVHAPCLGPDTSAKCGPQETDRPAHAVQERQTSSFSAPRHAVTVFGMSGVGKTRLAALLRQAPLVPLFGRLPHRHAHMGEFIVDNFKAEAMKVPFLRQLLRTDSIKIASQHPFSNLDPLSTYLGRPGDPSRGGLPLAEYQRRQEQHREGRDRRRCRKCRASSSGPTISTATPTSSPIPAAR
jgi:hypothetical protein